MATSSIYANIVIDSEEKARALLDALESSKEAVLRRKREGTKPQTYEFLRGDEAKAFLKRVSL